MMRTSGIMVIGILLVCLLGSQMVTAQQPQGFAEQFEEYVEQGNAHGLFSQDWGEDGDAESLDHEAEYFRQSGASELYNALPEHTKSLLRQSGIDGMSSDAFLQMGLRDFLSLLLSQLLSVVTTPVMVLSVTLGMVLLASLMGLLRTTGEEGAAGVFTVVAVLCIAGVIVTPIVQMIQKTAGLIQEINRFMLGFVPVYAGIVATSGKPVSAFTYNTILISATQTMAYLLTHILIPIIGIYLAFTIMGSATSQINMGAITKSLRTGVIWCLGFFITIFVALLTIRSFVAGAADTVAFRAGKFVVSSLLPVVGGAVGDSLAVIQGSLGVIRSTVGAFGIVVILLTFLSPIIELFLMSLALKIAQTVSEMMEISAVSSLLEAAYFVMSMMLAIIVFFALMLIVSLSMLLLLGSMT